MNPASPRSGSQIRQIEDSARSLGLKLQIVKASAGDDLDSAFTSLRQSGAGALLLATDPSLNAIQKQIAELAAHYVMPTMAASRDFVSRGGLLSYGASLPDSFRQAGAYTGRILKGEKPSDLPVLQPTKFDFVINL